MGKVKQLGLGSVWLQSHLIYLINETFIVPGLISQSAEEPGGGTWAWAGQMVAAGWAGAVVGTSEKWVSEGPGSPFQGWVGWSCNGDNGR